MRMTRRLALPFGILACLFLLVGCGKSSEAETDRYALSPEVIERAQPRGQYDPDTVAELEVLKANLTDAKERAMIDLLIASQNTAPGSPVAVAETRTRLQDIADTFPATWLSATAKIGLAATFGSLDPHVQRVNAWQNALNDPGLSELRAGIHPDLRRLLTEDQQEEFKDMDDLARLMLVQAYVQEFDLQSAEAAAAEIRSETWQKRAATHLDSLKALDSEVREARRLQFIEMQENRFGEIE